MPDVPDEDSKVETLVCKVAMFVLAVSTFLLVSVIALLSSVLCWIVKAALPKACYKIFTALRIAKKRNLETFYITHPSTGQ